VDLEQTATRRRGEALESAILDAAWAQLVESGYAAFTYEAIAARANTSRPVLYRRWPTRGDLLMAAMRRGGAFNSVRRPDTGSLRGDAISLLEEVNRVRSGFAALISVRAAEYFNETGTTFAEVRDLLRGGRRSGFQVIIEHAEARGELDAASISARVVELPIDLFRHELIMTMARVPDETIIEIIDEAWLPLLRQYGARV
jgi:AcrR family transcriptional regulator